MTVKGRQTPCPAGGKLRYNSPQNFFAYFLFSLLGTFFFTAVTQAQVTYQYDTYSTPYTGTPNGTGRVTSVTDPTGSTTFFYDARGNVIKTIKVIEGNSFTVESNYDSLNRVTTTIYPDTPNPEVVTNTYDAAGNLKTVTSPATAYVADITYNTFNQRTKITFGNNVSTTYSYDPNNFRLSQICTRLTLECSDPAATPAVLKKLSYSYDTVGNVTSITDLLAASNNQTFGYDSLNRLTVAKGVYGDFTNTPYQYDPIGNMTYNPLVGSYTYPQSGITSVRPHAVQTAGGSNNSYGYDDNGNMTSGPGRTVTYDMENRPTTIVNTITNKTVTMAYDYKGDRVKRAVGPEITYYVGDLFEKKGAATEKYIFAGPTRIALKNSGGSTYFYHGDHLGSTHLMTNASGVKEEEVHYTPFGATASRSGPVDVKHKYTGQELDTDVSLYHYKARYYDPVLGRFISPDWIGFGASSQAANRYSYVLNNPIRYIDPTGHYNQVPTNRNNNNQNVRNVGGTYSSGFAASSRMCGSDYCGGARNVTIDNGGGVSIVGNSSDRTSHEPFFEATEYSGSGQQKGGFIVKCPNDNCSEADSRAFQYSMLIGGPMTVGKVASWADDAARYIGNKISDAAITLYRAVLPQELADITATEAYRILPGQTEVKYFFTTAEDASSFARNMYFRNPSEGSYFITSMRVSQSELAQANVQYIAGEGTAVIYEGWAIPQNPITIMNSAPIPYR